MGAIKEVLPIRHPSANPIQIHGYGRQLIAQGKMDKAMEIFKYNHENFKGVWPTEVGMMSGLSAIGKYEDALKHAKIALTQAPDKLNKDGLANSIEKLLIVTFCGEPVPEGHYVGRKLEIRRYLTCL